MHGVAGPGGLSRAPCCAAGRSEDEIFEATAVRALDAAIGGYRAGLAALEAAR